MAIGTAAAIGLGIAGAGTVASTVTGARAAGRAADVQERAAERAIALQERQFEQTREDLAPWRRAGAAALEQYQGYLTGGIGTGQLQRDLEQYPGYQFALQQGTEAVEKSAAARGLLQSGQTLKGLTQYGQKLAASNVENYLNRLSGLAGTGQTVGAQLGQFGAGTAARQASLLGQGAQARASGYLGQAQAIGQGLGGIAQLGGYLQGAGAFGGANPMSSAYLGGGIYS